MGAARCWAKAPDLPPTMTLVACLYAFHRRADFHNIARAFHTDDEW
jgi:hypothetical protein